MLAKRNNLLAGITGKFLVPATKRTDNRIFFALRIFPPGATGFKQRVFIRLHQNNTGVPKKSTQFIGGLKLRSQFSKYHFRNNKRIIRVNI